MWICAAKPRWRPLKWESASTKVWEFGASLNEGKQLTDGLNMEFDLCYRATRESTEFILDGDKTNQNGSYKGQRVRLPRNHNVLIPLRIKGSIKVLPFPIFKKKYSVTQFTSLFHTNRKCCLKTNFQTAYSQLKSNMYAPYSLLSGHTIVGFTLISNYYRNSRF